MAAAGRIVILNGPPRSGKSSIAAVIQETFEGCWMNLGVDAWAEWVTPRRLRPGVGLRPGGGERADIEALIPALYAGLFESIAAHSRVGLNVVADLGLHDHYAERKGVLSDAARRLAGLPLLFVGIHCPLKIIMERRNAGADGRHYSNGPSDDPPPIVRLWSQAVHAPGVYDLELDTGTLTPQDCAQAIRRRLDAPDTAPSALQRLA
jgi:chloramphenicol 3-O phosphotransferase